jgi:hypothetical protein
MRGRCDPVSRRLHPDLLNPEDVEYLAKVVIPEIPDSVGRALDAGAAPPLEFMGAGASGIIYCDGEGSAVKVYRWYRNPELFRYKEAEAEFLADAGKSRVKDSVAAFYDWDPDLEVLFRECVRGRPGGWGTSGLSKLHDEIAREMERFGWTPPEYKEDSFVVESRHDRPTGRVVLVDAGSTHRIGDNLVRYVGEALAGERKHPERPEEMRFFLRREVREGAVDEKVAKRLVKRLGLSWSE